MAIPALVEGHMEAIFLPVLLKQIGRTDLQPIIRDAGGGAKFWIKAASFNQAGMRMPVLGLVDLEREPCAPALLAKHLPHKAQGFYLRVAVRMLESWLLADRSAIADFLCVSLAAIPKEPDGEPHPKRRLIELAKRSSNRSIREAMLPGDSGALVGPEYVTTMCQFIASHWQSERARKLSASLDRACTRWIAI